VLSKQINIPGVGVRDSAFFSVIDEEWPEVRTTFVAGLSSGRGCDLSFRSQEVRELPTRF
jgi:hypothetical protein